MDIRDTIRRNLAAEIRRSDLSQLDIAKKLNVSPGSVSNWLSGRNSIDLENLVKICKILRLSLDQVCGLQPISIDMPRTKMERELLTHYRLADNRARDDAITILVMGEVDQDF